MNVFSPGDGGRSEMHLWMIQGYQDGERKEGVKEEESRAGE